MDGDFNLEDLGIDDTSDLEAQANEEAEAQREEQETYEAEAEEEAQTLDEELENYMDLVDQRLEVASFYRALLKNSLFGNNKQKASIIVEKEVRDFCRNRLAVLMGIKQESAPVQATPINLPFSQDQIDALIQVANQLLNRAKGPSVAPTVVPARIQEPTVNPVSMPVSKTVNKPTRPAKNTATKPTKQELTAIPIVNKKRKAATEVKPNPLGLTNEKGEVVNLTNQLKQKPAGMVPFPSDLTQALTVQALTSPQISGSGNGGVSLIERLVTSHGGKMGIGE